MRDEPQIVADQRIPRLCGGCPPFADRQRPRAPVRRERAREGPAFEMQRQIQNMPCRRLQKQTKNAQHTHHLAEVYAGHGNLFCLLVGGAGLLAVDGLELCKGAAHVGGDVHMGNEAFFFTA